MLFAIALRLLAHIVRANAIERGVVDLDAAHDHGGNAILAAPLRCELALLPPAMALHHARHERVEKRAPRARHEALTARLLDRAERVLSGVVVERADDLTAALVSPFTALAAVGATQLYTLGFGLSDGGVALDAIPPLVSRRSARRSAIWLSTGCKNCGGVKITSPLRAFPSEALSCTIAPIS